MYQTHDLFCHKHAPISLAQWRILNGWRQVSYGKKLLAISETSTQMSDFLKECSIRAHYWANKTDSLQHWVHSIHSVWWSRNNRMNKRVRVNSQKFPKIFFKSTYWHIRTVHVQTAVEIFEVVINWYAVFKSWNIKAGNFFLIFTYFHQIRWLSKQISQKNILLKIFYNENNNYVIWCLNVSYKM